jgi:adenine-specific DNA-methyltransferase
LTVARDLLTDSGSIFVQIGDENVHRVRALMDEIFGEENFISLISFKKTGSLTDKNLASVCDYLIWYSKSKNSCKFRPILELRDEADKGSAFRYYWDVDGSVTTEHQAKKLGVNIDHRLVAQSVSLTSQHESKTRSGEFHFRKQSFNPPKNRQWSVSYEGLNRLDAASRIFQAGDNLRYAYLMKDNPAQPMSNMWTDGGTGSFTEEQIFVVQTAIKIVQRCILMTTDPGDLVLDPTCGSGTSAYVSEEWGRRWITIDTSRVALALARSRELWVQNTHTTCLQIR